MMRTSALLVILALFACGDDDGPSDLGMADAAVDGSSGGLDIEGVVLDPDDAPVEGAWVVAALPGGDRAEVSTDAAGAFVLEGVDFTMGELSVSVWQEGRRAGGVLGVTEPPEESPVTLRLFPLPEAPPATITVSGTISGLAAGDSWSVSSDKGGFDQADTGSYSFEVPAGEPFNVFLFSWAPAESFPDRGVEQDLFHSWVSASHAGSESDIDLDLELPADPDRSEVVQVTGSVLLPESGPIRERGGVFPLVFGEGFVPFLGAATRSEISAAGDRVEYTIAYVQPDYVEGVLTRLGSVVGAESSQLIVGEPPSGASDLQMLTPVTVVTPAFGAAAGLYDPMIIDDPGGAPLQLALFDADGGLVGFFLVPEGAAESRTLSIPAPPGAVDTSTIFGSAELDVRIQHCERVEGGDFCQRFTNSRGFGLMP